MDETVSRPQGDKEALVYRMAQEMFLSRPHWEVFFEQILGLDGVIRSTFTVPEELAEFERSETYEQIQRMLGELRRVSTPPAKRTEEIRVITVRVPASVYEALREEAYERETTVNKLCVSKLLQHIDDRLVPRDNRYWLIRDGRRLKPKTPAARADGQSPHAEEASSGARAEASSREGS
ncbi:MAG TPA: hypothetical protein EYP56_10840 [Planctomycetaceae bacterium]|nr:hypothetical protein [Planctomycetaceae bacterium]HIQ21416.1 hypothetical protein [Planctomycetota bacterium]